MRSYSVAAAVLVAALPFSVLGAACSPTPPAQPPPPPPSASAPPPPPPPTPARWVESGGGSTPGVRLTSKGTLVILAGKRKLVADDGTVTSAKGSESLDRLERVPSAGGIQVIGLGGQALYRFDDPLGEGKRIAVLPSVPTGLGTWPGLLAVRLSSGKVLWLDLDGKEVSAPAVPLVPTHVQFASEKRGLAVFPGAGMAHTKDGGATWALIDVRPSTDFDGDEGILRFQDWEIDESGAKVDLPKRKDPPLLRWLRGARLTPIEGAALGGIDIGGGKALVAMTDELFEVDLATGELGAAQSLRGAIKDEALEATPGLWAGTRVGSGASERALFTTLAGNYFTGIRPLVEVGLGAKERKPTRIKDGPYTFGMMASTSGGFLHRGACDENEVYKDPSQVPACVRQPNGQYKTIWTDLDEEGLGPLADGGLVGFSREDDVGGRDLVVFGPDGKRRKLGRACKDLGHCSPSHMIDEVRPGEYAGFVNQMTPDGGLPTAGFLRHEGGQTKVESVSGLMFATRGYARGRAAVETEQGLSISLDAGKTWKVVPGPKLEGNMEDIVVSEVGLVWGRETRIGWGEPAGEFNARREVAPDATIKIAPLKAQKITCELGKENKSVGFGANMKAGEALLAQPKPKGFEVHPITAWVPSRVDLRYELHVPETGDKKKSKSVVAWVDQTEIGAKIRTAGGPPPTDLELGRGVVSFAEAQGDKAFFVVRARSNTYFFGRVSGSKVEIVATQEKHAPKSAAIAADGSIAWVGDEGIGHWPAKGAPRVIAKVRPGQIAVAPPTKDGVPIVVGEKHWSAFRVVPLPKGDAVWLDVGGWTRTTFAPGELAALPVCGAKAPPHRFALSATTMSVAIGGYGMPRTTLIAVRTDGKTACLDGVTATLNASGGFARVDLVKKKAEGRTELVGPGATRTLTCKLE